MDARLSMRETLQDALDELVSPRTSAVRVGEVLTDLERLLAEIYMGDGDPASERRCAFIGLQDAFECNVPSRVLSWISLVIPRLEYLTSKRSDDDRKFEVSVLSSQLVQALSLVQGVALTHKASKRYLGRRYALQVLLDLLYIARHVPLECTSISSSRSASPNSSINRFPIVSPASIPLASAILDTLICVLVDSSPALRVFEEANGVQVVVKILRRAETPREVRMKCLEFIYFYLLDETAPASQSASDSTQRGVSPPCGDQSHPTHQRSLSDVSTDSSTSGYSIFSSAFIESSFSSVSAPSTPCSLTKCLQLSDPYVAQAESVPRTPTRLTPFGPSLRANANHAEHADSWSPMMLHKEGNRTPFSPKKVAVSRPGITAAKTTLTSTPTPKTPRSTTIISSASTKTGLRPQTPRASHHLRGSSLSAQIEASTRFFSSELDAHSTLHLHAGKHRRAQSSLGGGSRTPDPSTPSQSRTSSGSTAYDSNMVGVWASKGSGTRTMEEKKKILGSMLGNVDALVEGVRKAGIWGLA
ncbi:uncharacterized protein LAESUDRAFT_750520 [Laetiporus sulphureus 93-53]|uniref:CDC14-domain-containing protein n=1 Tax=Laetiporus sulphureus 93-53 TaxID=1314785 RepID=A0A165DTD9_9APHY|nr:uncharacterized protein LAESUDRAFT_750520 [Laetiporus sulphureus 93-53]KZT05593.1 hypothetical protein LAESUDRAFT_750520 [Laetiporus sulphureus 93-53]